MAKFINSQRAEDDLERIALYGIETFGLRQARLYQSGLEIKFQMLANNPRLGRSVDFIRAGYRRSVYESHSIYYTEQDYGILIGRVLGRQNVAEVFFDD